MSNAPNIQEVPDVCFGSAHYVVVWTDFRNGVDRIVRAARVTPQWVVLDSGHIVQPTPDYQATPVIAFDGSRYLVAWQNLAQPFGVYCRFIGADCLPQGPVIAVSTALTATNPRIVYDGVNYFVVWQEYTTTNNIMGRFISPTGTLVGGTVVITSGAVNHVSPAVCYDGDRFLVAWSQDQIWGQFVSNAGILVGVPFQISTSMHEQVDPDVFFGGGRYLAAWSEFRIDYDVYGNIDVQAAVNEPNGVGAADRDAYLDRTIFNDRVRVINGQGRRVTVFDVLGKKVAEIEDGVWEAPSASAGVYFLSIAGECVFRVIKVK
ncbi:MAG: hypothetical protein JSU64_02545 [candidate division WOR-3 bacterium]|nr:MAG: hypothetical protein JSU64_02545 [candidate division WOR-3 bacterium]